MGEKDWKKKGLYLSWCRRRHALRCAACACILRARTHLPGRRASRSEKALRRSTRTPAPPPSGEVVVAEAAAKSSQRVELGSGHPGEGRGAGGRERRGLSEEDRRSSGIMREAARRRSGSGKTAALGIGQDGGARENSELGTGERRADNLWDKGI
jgi:hypothetical protein